MLTTRSAVLALLLAGCSPVSDVVRLDPTPRAQRLPADVQVLASDPRQPYREIALVEVSGGVLPSLSTLTRALREEAARLGGDAVVIMGRSEGRSKGPGLLARVIVFEPSPGPR